MQIVLDVIVAGVVAGGVAGAVVLAGRSRSPRHSPGSAAALPISAPPLPAEREERDVVDGLARRGILVRAGTGLGREGALRVTVGTSAENRRFLAALGELI
jgi:hypothetical protein